ncbi:protein of unknown function DUF445 [Gluconacetobacter diazotrophicus PA1 5]|uniref:DUF445 domain-containing protein n=1 Tax=Gluconacetobacter diazotrophicus TaxID=33996 RepID=UPI000173D5A3|nr:DUF445 domain-containing protein [Gluconacetobacter diazotrophicus]ACI53034.1 protein of unknown function DUF445 [Gluconacetobacter diazotrophicus PA1 5]TWB07705.1 uncharacterized membrane-anchored protein YjiN (DUF445 family) [Gluconacetobacter diazotrophicus]
MNTIPTAENTLSEADRAAWLNLRRYRRAATGLLAGMGVLTAAGYAAPAAGLVGDGLWLDVLRSGAKAGVVGGLADWFAVTALFRHPLGLPIPHTAILPAQKARLGEALGRFVATHVFTEDDVNAALDRIDLPEIVAGLLDDPATAETVSRMLAGAAPGVMNRLEDGRAGSAMGRIMPMILGGEDVAPIVARTLRALVEGDRHQEVLSFLLARLKDGLKAKEASLRAMIEDRVREQGGRVLGWAIGGSIATKVLVAVNQELDRVDPQNSELRESFTNWVRGEIDRIETDPERRRDITGAIMGVVTHDSIRGWSGDVWRRMRVMIEADMRRPDGWSASIVQDTLLRLADQMRTDAALRERMVGTARRMILGSLPFLRERLSRFIASVVAGWDADLLSSRLELRVGKDLQFVRLNGTLVGFLAGAGLSLLLQLLFGRGAG